MAAVKNRGLGRGLSALLADAPTAEVMRQAAQIPISKIQPNSYQPRTHFSHDELDTLTESIRSEGVLMPILLRPKGDGYELIAGERRWRASQAAGHKIPQKGEFMFLFVYKIPHDNIILIYLNALIY